MYKCQNCGTEYESKFCPECGAPRPLENCPHCGGALNGSTKFCPECGRALDGTPTAPKPKRAVNDDTVYKIYNLLKYLPLVIFALFSILAFAFYAGPVAVMPKVLDGDSYGNVYSMKGGILGEFPELTGEMYVLIILAVISVLFSGAVLAVFLIQRKVYKPFYAVCGFCLLIYFIISIIIMAKISKYADSSLVLCGVSPKLLLGFSIAFGAISAAAIATRVMLRKNDADISARDEAALAAEFERQTEFFDNNEPPEEPTLANPDEPTNKDIRDYKKHAIQYKHDLIRYYAAKDGKAPATVVWLDLHKVPIIIVAAAIAIAIILVCILVPYFGNTFRIEKVKKICLGSTQSQVQEVLGDPYQSTKQNDTWYYVDESFANANDRIKKYTQKQESATLAGDFYISLKLEEKIQQVREQLQGMTYKYIEVKFEKVDDEYLVASVLFDTARSSAVSEKTEKSVDVHVNNVIDYYIDYTVDQGEANVLNTADLTYSAEFTDGSYIHTKATQAKAALKDDVATVEWSDGFCDYNKAVGVDSFRKIGKVSRDGKFTITCNDIEKLTLPDSVTSIGSGAFNGCDKLIQIENGVSYVDRWAIGCNDSVTSVRLRSNTVGIADKAFNNCNNLLSITIPDSVTNIGQGAFSDCKCLWKVTILSNVVCINEHTFSGCTDLTNITIPDSVTSIGSSAFEDCSSLTSITIPNSVTCIGSDVFSGCSNLIQKEDRVQYVDKWVIDCDRSVASVTLRSNTVGIGGRTFYNCSRLMSITIPNSVTSIGNYVFENCNILTNITFNGTKAQWEAIKKESCWNHYTGDYTIHCTDGDIAKSNS